MYIIFEGMPVTGKTTTAKMLAEKLNAKYLKSVVSNTAYGDLLQNIREREDIADLFYQSDLLMDELRVLFYLRSGNVVRDKTWVSTLAHLKTHDIKIKDESMIKLLKQGYQQLKKFCAQPDLLVYLLPDYKKINSICKSKKDFSAIDNYLTSNMDIYKRQEIALRENILENFSNVLQIQSFISDEKEMCDVIIKYLQDKADEKKYLID